MSHWPSDTLSLTVSEMADDDSTDSPELDDDVRCCCNLGDAGGDVGADAGGDVFVSEGISACTAIEHVLKTTMNTACNRATLAVCNP